MKDHRINRKELHPLEKIVAITIVAVICNVDTIIITRFGYRLCEHRRQTRQISQQDAERSHDSSEISIVAGEKI
jgi:hypothetical protein